MAGTKQEVQSKEMPKNALRDAERSRGCTAEAEVVGHFREPDKKIEESGKAGKDF